MSRRRCRIFSTSSRITASNRVSRICEKPPAVAIPPRRVSRWVYPKGSAEKAVLPLFLWPDRPGPPHGVFCVRWLACDGALFQHPPKGGPDSRAGIKSDSRKSDKHIERQLVRSVLLTSTRTGCGVPGRANLAQKTPACIVSRGQRRDTSSRDVPAIRSVYQDRRPDDCVSACRRTL